MLSKFRNYSKFIIIIVAVAMVFTGGLWSYSAYLNKSTTASSPSNYIASINDAKISHQQFYTVLQNRSAGRQLERSEIVPFQLNVLDSIIDTEVILQEADKLNLKPQVTDEDVQNYLDEILKANEMTREDLANYFKEQGGTIEEYEGYIREVLEQNNLIEQVQERSYSNVQVTEEELIQAYEEIKPQVIIKEFGEDKEKAEQEVKEALNKIKEGADFGQVAHEYSDLQVENGDIGFIGRNNGYFPDDVTETLFSLNKGEISEILEGPKNFYLAKIVDKKTASGEDYEEKKEELKKTILEQKQSIAFSNWLENARAESDIEIYDPLLKGYKALTQGEYQLAVDQLSSALEDYSTPMTYVYLANAYQRNNQPDKAIETFETALTNFEDDWELIFNYGHFLTTLEEPQNDKALELYDKASDLAGEDFMAHYQLYMAYSQLGEEEKAQKEIEIINEIQKKLQEEQEKLEQNSENPENNQTGEQAIDEEAADTDSETTSE